jgi:hypothetical protein
MAPRVREGPRELQAPPLSAQDQRVKPYLIILITSAFTLEESGSTAAWDEVEEYPRDPDASLLTMLCQDTASDDRPQVIRGRADT